MFEYKVHFSNEQFTKKVSERYYTRNDSKLVEFEGEQEKVIGLLEQFPGNLLARALAKALSDCEPEKRCRSVGCVYCRDAAFRYFKRTCDKKLDALLTDACRDPIRLKRNEDRSILGQNVVQVDRRR